MAQKTPASSSEEILQLGLRFGESVRVSLFQRKPPQLGKEDWIRAISMGMFAAGLKYYKSIDQLIRAGFEESAAVISRAIFDLSLQARFLQQNPDRIEDYIYWSDFNRYRVVLRCRDHPDEEIRAIADVTDRPDSVVRFQELKEHYNEHKHRYRNRKDVWHGLNTKVLADECGEEASRDYAIMYWRDSNLGHANPTGMEHFVKVEKEGRRIKLLVDPAPPVNNWVAWRSTQNLFFILYFVNEAWDLELEIETGDRQLHEIMQRKL